MRALKLFLIAAVFPLTVIWCRTNAGPSVEARTNAPAARFYSVGGSGVLSPDQYAYHEGITISNAIHTAGGFLGWARTNKVEIIRKGQTTAMVVDVSKIYLGQAADVLIEPDDYIRVQGPKVYKKLPDR